MIPAALSGILYRRLLGYVRPYWKLLVLAMLLTAVTASTEWMLAALMKPLLDQGFTGQAPHYLYLAPLAIIGLFIVRGLFGFAASYGMSRVSNQVIFDIRGQMFERIMRLPTSYLHDNPSSRLITRVSNDVNGVAGAATSVINTALRDSLSVIGLLGFLIYSNWRLTLLMAVVAPPMAFIVRTFSKRMRSMSRASQEGIGAMTQVLQESIDGHKVVKVYCGEAQEVKRFDKINNNLRRFAIRQNIAAAATVPLVHIFASFAVAFVVYLALSQSATGGMTAGGFMSFIMAMMQLLSPIKNLADMNAPLQRGLAAAESIFTLLDEKPEDDRGKHEIVRATGRIVMEGVRFRYPGAEREALTGIDLVIEPGQTVALVGPSGGGKTTLANLLPRFYHVAAGRIMLDGYDLEELKLSSLRANIALVSQEVVLFDDSIANNIAYGSLATTSRTDVEAAARAAYAHDFIVSMPQGYDTLIGENGVRLSGGQRQRLAIARALLKNAPILILDEATSALDSESERQVQAALEHLMEDRTTLVIAHRLSTIEGADKIVALEHGHVVEQGKHAELLASDGLYAKLYRMQYALEHTT
ncbi:MAG: lipid A export permease/ATP-binding protein MsbA [Georgfuchsia sp.]